MGPNFHRIAQRFFRLKNVGDDVMETRMKRCLSTTDITLLGVGHMIGAGIYVLTGSVVRNTAGPSIVLSFILAGFASLLSALCYAEFGARFPKAGSAYTYTYIGVGELWAFIIGWNIILEHMLGAAAVARSWSGYLDSLLGQAIKNSTITNLGHLDSTSFFGDYPDLVAFVVVIVVAVFIALGSKTSTNFNSVFTLINMCVIIFVVGYGMTFADFSLWTGDNPKTGVSNFFPMGVNGMIAGAASCFFAYIGFDGLATAGEEAANPSRAIPLATFVSMSIVTTAYVFMSAALTLMVPYTDVHPTAAFSDAFEKRGAVWAKYAVSLGALSGMTTSLVGSMFALPRCVYAMAQDGLIFKTFAHINEKTKVPVNAVVVFGAATAIIALLFDIETLVEFLSIGTLMAYTIVSACVIILRYRPSMQDDAGDINVNYGNKSVHWGGGIIWQECKIFENRI
uniref:AA_permease_C domain-containing protein n=1 Tax=Steinernema glaseri TaxID=37863 RepID=A0A1I7ZPD1_9BILA